MITDREVEEIELRAYDIRDSIVTMLNKAGSGHMSGSLDMADVFACLFFKVLKHDVQNPFWEHRDRLILSNGHICPVLYASLAHSGYIYPAELLTLRSFGSRLQGHPHREYLPFLETSSGPLGEGLSQAIGMALMDKINIKNNLTSGHLVNNNLHKKYFYCLMGDGEMNEGQIWEALMLLSKNKITNIITIIDRNNIQIDGNTEDIMPLEPLKDKLEAFNFNVLSIDGHDIREIVTAISIAKENISKPSIIIANTIAGKGWREIEGDYHWHGKAPSGSETDKAHNSLSDIYSKNSYQ